MRPGSSLFLERAHRDDVLQLLEAAACGRRLRQGVGRDQLRILRLEGLELVVEPVVLGVRDLRVVEDVVAVEVVLELLAELFGPCSSESVVAIEVMLASTCEIRGRGRIVRQRLRVQPDREAFPYGTTWRRSRFTCTIRRIGLRCTNRTKNGFFLSRQRSYRF